MENYESTAAYHTILFSNECLELEVIDSLAAAGLADMSSLKISTATKTCPKYLASKPMLL